MILLQTERLLLRHPVEADLDAYCAMMADPEFRHLCGGPPLPRERAEQEFRNRVLQHRPQGLGMWALELKAEGRYIGRCGVYEYRDENNRVIPGQGRLGYYLARPYWGCGLATEAARALVEYAFREWGLARIEAGINATNRASQRVVEKLGFVWIRSGEGGGNAWHDYELCCPTEGTPSHAHDPR